MKYIMICAILFGSFILSACGIEPLPNADIPTDDSDSDGYIISENISDEIEDVSMGSEEDIVSASTQSNESESSEYYYPFIEDMWVRETVEEFRERTDLSKDKFKVSQKDGKVIYTTDFDESMIVYEHITKETVYDEYVTTQYIDMFVSYSFGGSLGHTVCMPNYIGEVYTACSGIVTDIFAYGGYIYYISHGQEGFYGGINRMMYVDDHWVNDSGFWQNEEVANIPYFKGEYNFLQKACVYEDEVYIIASSKIYTFDGTKLTSVYDSKIINTTYSVTRIGDSFYIGEEGYIAECNIVTGEEYVWVRVPQN